MADRVRCRSGDGRHRAGRPVALSRRSTVAAAALTGAAVASVVTDAPVAAQPLTATYAVPALPTPAPKTPVAAVAASSADTPARFGGIKAAVAARG